MISMSDKRKVPAPLESSIQEAILEALAARGFWAWRVNSGATVIGSGAGRRMFRGAPSGTPDIRVESPVSGYLEVKRPGGKLSESQWKWHERAAKHGVRVAIVHSASEALHVMGCWRLGL
jgi:hypothetical protein